MAIEYRGCRKLVYAEVLTDTADGMTFGEVKPLAPVQQIQREVSRSSATTFYDNVAANTITAEGAEVNKFVIAVPTDEVLSDIEGKYYDPEAKIYSDSPLTGKQYAVGYVLGEQGDEADEDFCWKLEAGETFETPQAVIAYSAEGIDGMSQAFHHFIREHLITYRHDKAYKPVLFNSWEGCYFNFNTESVISYIDDAIKIGTELFVLDDGWFGARNSDRLGLGDWYVNRQKVDLHKIIAHCKEKGIKFGIWFEPEMVNPVSDLYAAHPDYVPGEPDAAELSLHRHQLHLDFSAKEVVDNIYAQMKAFLEEYPVSYIKWDYNRVVNEHFSRHYPADRQGEIYHRMMLGYYDLIGRLTREYPDIMFEGCSSGGGRFDLGTLYFCPQIWTSDESDPSQRIAIQYNTSLGYPLSTIGAHVNDSKVSSYKTKAILALFGTYGYEMNPNILTASEQEELREIAEIYCKYHQSVIGNGTLYHLLSPNEGNLMCMQSVSKDQTASLVILMNYRKEHAQFRVIRLRGLDPEKQYKNSYTGTVHSGTFYMERGIDFSRDCFASINCRLVILTEEA